MSNRNQLRILTDDQAAAITALGNGLAVCELVRITWPGVPEIVEGELVPTFAPTVYAWWQPLNDELYHNPGTATPLADWLDDNSIDGDIHVAFEAQDEQKAQKFHEIPRTAAIGDDVVRFRFRNDDGAFEVKAIEHAGAKVELWWFFPQLEDGAGLAVQMWQGRLRTPERVDRDFVEISAVEGFASPDLLVPSRVHAGQCTFAARFGGRFDPVLPNNPCDYDAHVGGSRGTPGFTSCGGTKEDCRARLGDLKSYGGFDAVANISSVGGGQHTTVSETQSQSTRLKEPVDVWYGSGKAVNLKLLDFAKQYNPSDKEQNQAFGTIRALFECSEGPIANITNVKAMDRDFPRPGLFPGFETRLGTQQQVKTSYSSTVLNYNRLAHLLADVVPIDPRGVTASQITGQCTYEGRNSIRVYTDASDPSDPDTYDEAFTQLRAWVALDLVRDFVYGLAEDPAEHSIEDFIYLAGKGSTFNGIAQGKSAHQQFTDLALAGMWFLPFNHNGVKRWLALEDYDFTADDIPLFTDSGSSRNILVDERGVSRLTATRKDDDQIPNEVTLTFEDAAHDSLERPLLFPDVEQQELAGQKFGNSTLRKVPQQYFALGVNNEDDARRLGWYLLDYGPFYSGGTKNNGTVVFYGRGSRAEYLDLHVNKVIELQSDKLDNIKDRDGNPFTHFLVTALRNLPNGEMEVTAQAFKALRRTHCALVDWTNVTRATVNRPGNLEKTTDSLGGLGCVTNASGSGDAGGRSVQKITGDSDWELHFSFDANTEGRGFGGLTTASAFTNNYAQMRYCVHVSDQNNTIQGYPPHSWFIYESGVLKEHGEGEYVAGDLWRIKCVAGVVSYYLNDELKYTSATAPSYPMYAAASLACLNKTIDNVAICQNEAVTGGDGSSGTQTLTDSRFVLIDRVYRDEDFQRGVPGIYVAAGPTAAPTTTEPWPEFELYRDIEGYSLIHETTREAIIGTAASVLPDTTTGTEYVDVDLREGQSLPSFTTDQQLAGQGAVYLGGEFFLYLTADQQSTSPNRWRLSGLANRGAYETASYMSTHAIGEDFCFLDDPAPVIFVPLASSEIGQTRDYKGITAGQALGDYSPVSFTFNAPNFVPVTPNDYNVTNDLERNAVIHDWSGLAMNGLLHSGTLVYQIWEGSPGPPGELIWEGLADRYVELISASEDRSYWLHAVTSAASGNYEAATPSPLSVVYTPGGATSNLVVKGVDGSPTYSTISELQVEESHGFILTQPAGNKAKLDLGQYTVTAGLGLTSGGSAYLGSSVILDMDETYPHTWLATQTINPTNVSETGSIALKFDRTVPVATGRRDSHELQFIGRAYDGSAHQIEFRLGVDVQSNDALTSVLQVRTRYEGTGNFGLPLRLDTVGGLTLGMSSAELVPSNGVLALRNASSAFVTSITTQIATESVQYRLPAAGPTADGKALVCTAPIGGISDLSWGNTVTAINSTDGALPYRSSATAFADSPISRINSTTVQVAAINGGAAANDDITIQGTSHSTRTSSYVFLQPSGGAVGVGAATISAHNFQVATPNTATDPATSVMAAWNSTNSALILQGAVSQSVPIFQIQDSAAAIVYSVSVSGGVMTGAWSIGGGGSLTISTGGTGNDLYRLNNVAGGGRSYYLGSLSTGQFSIYDNTASAYRLLIDSSGNVGIGATTISAKLHALATTEQLRLGYDGSNYVSFTVSSSGDLTVAPTGEDLVLNGHFSPSTDGLRDLGGSALRWRTGYFKSGLALSNATSGTITLQPVTGALGTVTLSLPAATDTLVGKATTDTLTNKTLSTGTAITVSVTYTAGVKQTFAPDATNAGLNVGSLAGDPSSLANGDIWYNSTSNALKARINGVSVALGAGGGSLSDADYGDITVSSTGAVWTIDNDVVTFAKMQNIATAKVLGRATAGSGDVEELATTGTGNVVMSAIPTVVGGSFTALATLGIHSTGSGNFDLRFANTENLSGNRTLTITLGNASRSLSITGTSVINQDLTTTASPTFAGATIPTITWTGSVKDLSGSGSPESVVTAAVGSVYRRTDGGASTSLYVKESGAGDTGWVAYGPPGGSGAPSTSQYLVLATDGALSAERRLVFSDPNSYLMWATSDGGANGDFTVSLDTAQFSPQWNAAHTFLPAATTGTTGPQLLVLSRQDIAVSGQRDSTKLVWKAKSYDGSLHTSTWMAYVQATSTSGTSTWRLDLSTTAQLSVTDAGNMTLLNDFTMTNGDLTLSGGFVSANDYINTNSAYKIGGSVGTAGHYLRSDGASGFVDGAIAASDFGTSMTPQFARVGIGAAADGTYHLNLNGAKIHGNSTGIGIGTSTPGSNDPSPFVSKLDVNGNDNSNVIALSVNNAGTFGAGLLFMNGSTRIFNFNYDSALTVLNSATTRPMTFWTNGGERMRIDSAGNVGIGTAGGSYVLQLGTDSAGKPNGGSWANSSDETLKRGIVPLDGAIALARLSKLKEALIEFEYRNHDLHGTKRGERRIGYGARAVQKHFPAWVQEVQSHDNDKALTANGKHLALSLPTDHTALQDAAIIHLAAQLQAALDRITQLENQ